MRGGETNIVNPNHKNSQTDGPREKREDERKGADRKISARRVSHSHNNKSSIKISRACLA